MKSVPFAISQEAGCQSPAKGQTIEVKDTIVQRSEIGGGADAARIERRCAKCNNKLQEGWAICPFCGTKLELKCPECRKTIQPEWMAYPFCGNRLK